MPVFPNVPPPRTNRTVGIFYFLWHGAHIQGGPYDITRILATNPHAMEEPGSPLWGPLHAPHHWGESLFGYYLTRDDAVLRKHAQMLSDAGIDVVIFDVTNQITYREDYMALLRVWAEFRKLGNPTPQVAFLTPFWAPAKVTRELWKDLYSQDLYRDLWFQWEGKPLLLADRELLYPAEENAQQNTAVALRAGHSLGQTLVADRPFKSVAARCPTWRTTESALTLTLWRTTEKKGTPIARQRFAKVSDNSWLKLKLPEQASAGAYYLEATDPSGQIGWWSHSEDVWPKGDAVEDGSVIAGDRTIRLEVTDDETARMQDFFTFRKPQPDYFQGPTQPDMWSWLEVYPQHAFTNAAGMNEEMSVGVAQNAVGGRLGSMSEPGARGRSFHHDTNDTSPEAIRHGFNVQEQWNRALQLDPACVFVTGWNEWIAGRFHEFNGVKRPVMFVDQFDEEHSRDIEPMRGGHGDDYYWQLVSYIRRYKGARPFPSVRSHPIQIDGDFRDWQSVEPQFRDTVGDPMRRDCRGWDANTVYRNTTGRNDIFASRMTWNGETAYFYVATEQSTSSPSDTNWMVLLIDIDGDDRTGWLGYDFAVNRLKPGSLESCHGPGFSWTDCGLVQWKLNGNQLELAIPWNSLNLSAPPKLLDFKWADNCLQTGTWADFTLNGDAAPNDRFNYRALLK